MELVIALISLVTALIGLIGVIAGKKQVIIIRQGPETADDAQDRSMAAAEERRAETTAPPREMPIPSVAGPETLQTEQLHWYDKTPWLVVSFILCWPAGLYGMAKSRAVKKGWKIVTFVIFGLILLLSALQ